MRSTMVVYRKSRGEVVTRLPAHMMSVDGRGRVRGRENMYLILSHESDAAAHVEECKRRARETGERVKIESWITNRCHNGNDDQCSFDNAVRWAMPDGTTRTTYTCCF